VLGEKTNIIFPNITKFTIEINYHYQLFQPLI